MFTDGDYAGWLNAVASKIMDGGDHPPSIDRLNVIVPPIVGTRESDGHCTAAKAFGEDRRKDKEAGWRVIIAEMTSLLREQGFVGGSDEALTWIKPSDGTWRVAMPDGVHIAVYGQRERRMSRDRAVVGERDEMDGHPIGPPSSFDTGRAHPLTLQVIGVRGGITEQSFELHPLALAIPAMTERERETLRMSIDRDGVKVPIVIYQKKILDGRNRAYFASIHHKPVHISVFEGTEAEARRHVAILNLHRRHLSTVQRYLVADNLFGMQADKEAAEAMLRGTKNPRLKTAEGSEANGRGRSEERAVRLANEAGIPVKSAGMRAVRELRNAPETLAKIASGEIKTVAAASVAARAEKNLPASVKTEGVETNTVNKRLGICINQLNAILIDCDMSVGSPPENQISLRLKQIESLVSQVRLALRQRKIIS